MHIKKQILDLQVIKHTSLNDQHAVLTCTSEEKLPELFAGQFAEISAGDTAGTFLRRPFSIHDYNAEENTVSFLIQIKGNGSAIIGSMQPGEYLNVILPLGNSFSMPAEGEKVLLTGGGCGVAPLLLLAKSVIAAGASCDILIGARDEDNLMETEELSVLGTLFTTTEDGSEGIQGFVTDHPVMQELKENYSRVYSCGPDPMMKAVATIAEESGVECEVSLENTMACGIGACLCCVTDTTEGHKCVCTDGPVFNSKELKWHN